MSLGKYEKQKDNLAPLPVFINRVVWNLVVASAILSICLIIGILGYHLTAHASWIDSVHNASMILSGMGPVIEIKTTTGKLFSSFYALFSGVVFITNIGIILAPMIHRIYHRFHIHEK
jgi:hypothetical protein